MKKLFEKIRKIEPSKGLYLLLTAAVALLKLIYVGSQRMILYPEASMLDDMLMVQAAENILEGSWLGAYNYLTIGKHMLFALWLALVSKVGISYLLAGQLLFTAASFAITESLAPAVKNRLLRLCLFTYLVMSPASYADFTLRIYRDNITVSFVLLVLAGFVGFALRLKGGSFKSLLGWSALGGFALGCSYLLREDGWWLLPFCVVAALVCIIILIKERPKKVLLRLTALLCSAAVAAVLILGYCGMNYKHYGRFIVSDLTSPEFQAAYGAMTRVVVPEEEYDPIVPIPLSSREKLYEVSPLFAELRPYLESPEFTRWQKICTDGTLQYSGGGFYWAVRNAASLAGYYETADTAKAYFEALAAEINEGLEASGHEILPERSGLNSPITAERILPTLKEAVRSLYTVTTYAKINCSSELSYGSEPSLKALEEFANCGYQRTEKAENPDTRVVFWAFDEFGPVTAEMIGADGSAAAASYGRGAGSDVYLDQLYGGEDMRYTDACRYYATFGGEMQDGMELRITASDGRSLSLPLEAMQQEAEADGIHCMIEMVSPDYTETPSYGFLEIWLYRLMRVVTLGYRVLNPILFALGVFFFFRRFILGVKNRALGEGRGLALLIAFGLLMMGALRIGMVSFAEVSAFGIGTFPMYLAAVYPILTAFQFLSFSFASDR